VAQLQFQRIHAADQLLVHLLDQSRIPREPLGIQIAHFIDQGLQLLPRLGAILHCGTNLVQQAQALFNLALRIGWIGTLLGRDRLTGNASIAGVKGAICVPVAIARTAPRIADLTGDAVADLPRLASATLASLLLAAALTTLTWLAPLTLLATSALLS